MNAMPEVGDLVRIVGAMDDPYPLEVGTEGIVRAVNPGNSTYETQIFVDWHVKRSLILLASDPFIIVG